MALGNSSIEACKRSELEARHALGKKWSHYEGADRTTCMGRISHGGHPSYVELQSCLESFRHAREIRAEAPDEEERMRVDEVKRHVRQRGDEFGRQGKRQPKARIERKRGRAQVEHVRVFFVAFRMRGTDDDDAVAAAAQRL